MKTNTARPCCANKPTSQYFTQLRSSLNLLDNVTRGLVPRPVPFQGVFVEALSAVTEIIIIVTRSRHEFLLIRIWVGIPQLGLRVSGAHTCITGRLRMILEEIQNVNETFRLSLRFFGLEDEIISLGARKFFHCICRISASCTDL